MNEPLAYSAAFLLGLIGSPHCVGMCGGIASLLATTTGNASTGTRRDATQDYIPIADRDSWQPAGAQAFQLLLLVLFQLGRITCYAFLGALAGGLIGGVITASSFAIDDLAPINTALRLLASAMLIIIALSICGWTRFSEILERIGARLWKDIQPLSRPLLPVDTPLKAVMIGALWGFLPCGLIYSALAWAAMAGQAGKAALLMFCFGLGTLPAVLGVSVLSNGLRQFLNRPLNRKIFALLLIAIAVLPWLGASASHHSEHKTGHETDHEIRHDTGHSADALPGAT